MDTSTKRFVKKNDFVTRNIKDETIIVPVKGDVSDLDSIYTLNEVGSFVWNLLDGQTSVGEIVDAVCSEYDITPEEAQKDVKELIGSLEKAGLIHSSEDNQEKQD
ncbi:MAG: PqqD family protein [Candidatus Aminicenantaceae bacterium]